MNVVYPGGSRNWVVLAESTTTRAKITNFRLYSLTINLAKLLIPSWVRADCSYRNETIFVAGEYKYKSSLFDEIRLGSRLIEILIKEEMDVM